MVVDKSWTQTVSSKFKKELIVRHSESCTSYLNFDGDSLGFRVYGTDYSNIHEHSKLTRKEIHAVLDEWLDGPGATGSGGTFGYPAQFGITDGAAGPGGTVGPDPNFGVNRA